MRGRGGGTGKRGPYVKQVAKAIHGGVWQQGHWFVPGPDSWAALHKSPSVSGPHYLFVSPLERGQVKAWWVYRFLWKTSIFFPKEILVSDGLKCGRMDNTKYIYCNKRYWLLLIWSLCYWMTVDLQLPRGWRRLYQQDYFTLNGNVEYCRRRIWSMNGK